MSEFAFISDLLSADPSGHGLKQVQEELFVMRSDLKRAMDAGLTSEEMAHARQAMAAVDASEQVASSLYDKWNR